MPPSLSRANSLPNPAAKAQPADGPPPVAASPVAPPASQPIASEPPGRGDATKQLAAEFGRAAAAASLAAACVETEAQVAAYATASAGTIAPATLSKRETRYMNGVAQVKNRSPALVEKKRVAAMRKENARRATQGLQVRATLCGPLPASHA